MTVIAIDVGGTAIKCALVDQHWGEDRAAVESFPELPDTTPDHPIDPRVGRQQGEVAERQGEDLIIRHTERHLTHAEAGPDAVVERVLGIAERLVERARGRGPAPQALGIVVPGVVDETNGVARYAANLGWVDVPLAALATERVALPTTVGHDVRTGGLAEARLGAGRGVTELLFVPVGTGIAAAHLIAGRPVTGAHGAACELGHVVVRPGGRRCGCGRLGCLEAEASAKAIADRYAEVTATTTGAAATGAVTAAEVATRARTAEPAATEIWEYAVAALADGLLTAVTLFDPELIVLGGGLAEAGDQLLTPLTAALDARRTFESKPSLVTAQLGDQAGCLGAALLATQATPGRRPRPQRPTRSSQTRAEGVRP